MHDEFSSLNKINTILDNEKNVPTECWSKLSKTVKKIKLEEYADKYCSNNNYPDEIKEILKKYFKQCVERKKIHKKTDIKYNKDTQEIEEVYHLLFHKTNKKFTIKKQDHSKKTMKNKNTI